MSAGAYTAYEAGPALTVTATRIGGSTGAVGVSYATATGTATAGLDFTAGVDVVADEYDAVTK